MISQSCVTILVKASPQPSKKHNETVCCAGIDEYGNWKRLFPIRYRQLSGEKAFSRWDIVSCKHELPRTDKRLESCRVHEESIKVIGSVKKDDEKSSLIDRAVVESEKHAIESGASLAIIRPLEVDFCWKRRTSTEVERLRESFFLQAAQLSMLDKELEAYQPCPYEFKMHYKDGSGPHKKTCADWETSATFYNLSRGMDEASVLRHLQETYCDVYVKKGIVFALGNMQKRPQTWQLLGIFPVKTLGQPSLF